MNGYEYLKSNMNFQNVYKNGVSYANKYLVYVCFGEFERISQIGNICE